MDNVTYIWNCSYISVHYFEQPLGYGYVIEMIFEIASDVQSAMGAVIHKLNMTNEIEIMHFLSFFIALNTTYVE